MKVFILGKGYVGSKVASQLCSKGHEVTATSSRDDQQAPLQNQDALIVTVASKNRDDYEKTYLQTAKNLKEIILKGCGLKQLIYTSSTSSYGDSPQSKILAETEEVYLSLTKTLPVTILRLSGIYGPGREISNYLKPTMPGSGQLPTNMVHVDDVCSVILFTLEHQLQGVYDISDDDHPTRSEYYRALCDKLSLEMPTFDPSLPRAHGGNRVISNAKIKQAGYTFIHPHRLYL